MTHDSVLYYSNVLEKSSDNLHKSFAKASKGYYYQLNGDTLNSNTNFKEAELFLDKSNPSLEKSKGETYLLNLEGLTDWKRMKYLKAIGKFDKGKNISKTINDQKQIILYNTNIASVYSSVGNYKSAINIRKEVDSVTYKISNLYSKEQFFIMKSTNCLNIGIDYLKLYLKESNKNELDSSDNYFKKALDYSKDITATKSKVLIGLGCVFSLKNNKAEAEKYFSTAVIICKENELNMELCNAFENLGELYFDQKEYDKSIVYFNKVDSLNKKYNLNQIEFIASNYYKAKIYSLLGQSNKALYFSEVFLNEYAKNENDIVKQSIEINSKIENKELNRQVLEIRNNSKKKRFYDNLMKFFIGLFLIGVVVFLFKTLKEKKEANKKFDALMSEFEKNVNIEIVDDLNEKQTSNIKINDEKELEILKSLQKLIEKKYFLSVDFNQQNVAKKIKTNTTYLSYVVNKNFGKSFSEYSNELKINYAINELINNPIYRKYSTLAIAESVGFKNPISFTKSFKKRAGVSPAQFILKLNNKV